MKLKPVIAKQAKEQQGTRTDISQKSAESYFVPMLAPGCQKSDNPVPQKSAKPINTKIGRMLKEIPKATTNHKSLENRQDTNFLKPKSEVIKELGFSKDQTAQFQQMADHEPEVRGANATFLLE